MNKKYILVEVLENWKPGDCAHCENMCYESASFSRMDNKSCPLSDCKEAVELNGYGQVSDTTNKMLEGKPVKLWATLEDK